MRILAYSFALLQVFLGLACQRAMDTAGATPPGETIALTPMISIPAGPFLMGSTPEEREYGYSLDESLHQSNVARQNRWFENETRQEVIVSGYSIDINLVTNRDYGRFVQMTGHRHPFVSREEWQSYGLLHEYATVEKFLWQQGRPPIGRDLHPVVLVSHADATAYCAWRGQREGRPLRLPGEEEWEKAARGTDGRYFPWGNRFEKANLNSADGGPFDTVPVGQYVNGKSPYGVLDMAGQVFEWTTTARQLTLPVYIVKGGSWDDYPGVTRAAARHGRPAGLKHILVGFRCVAPLANSSIP